MAVQLSSLRVSADLDPTRYVAGMNAKVAADKAGAASSVQVGQAVTQTQQKISAAGDPLTRLSRQYVEGFRASEQFERAVATLGRGIETGNIPLQRAGVILDGIYRKYGMTANATELMERGQVSLAGAVAAANTRFAAQANQLDAVTASAMRAATANDNLGSGRAQTANVAAQFQDIGVTAAMGMSPIMIALQQGTQLSAALGNQGLRGTVTALGGAFASIISPVSLLTIGVIALGTYGVQALMGMMNSTEDATTSLEEHSKWLDKILYGYDAARDAAQRTADEAQKLPKGAAQSELGAGQAAAAARFADELMRIDSIQKGLQADLYNLRLAPDVFSDTISFNEQLVKLSLTASSTNTEFDQFITTMTQLKNDSSLPQSYRDIAAELLGIANAARSVRGEADGATASLQALAGMSVADWTAAHGGLLGVTAAVDSIKKMTPELRSQREMVNDIFKQSIGQARTTSEIDALVAANDNFNASLSEQERRQEALKAGRAGGKTLDQWGSANDNFQQRIDGVRLEMVAIGQSTFEAERNKAAFDLLNQAKQAGIPITAALTGQINSLAGEYATAQVELTRMQEAQRLASEQMEFYRGTFGSFFTTFAQGIREGAGLWDSFANAAGKALDSIADRALSMAANGIFDMIFGAVMGGLTGGFGGSIAGGASIPSGGFIPGMTGPRLFATGTPSAPPGMAWVGEEGPELVKFKGGQRVYSHQTSMGMAANQNTPAAANNNGMLVQIIDQRKRGGSIEQQSAAGPNGEKQLRLFIRDEVRDARRRGAVGF